MSRCVNVFKKILEMAVKMIVHGIKNSTQEDATSTMRNVLKARVMACPIVKAVTKINTCRQSFSI